jgi:hypothetical protein
LSSICGVGTFVRRLDTHYAMALTWFCTSETKIFMFCSLIITCEPRSSVSILLHFAAKNFWSTQSFETHDVEITYCWEVVLAMMWNLSSSNLKIVHGLLHHLSSCTRMELSCPSHSSRVLILLVRRSPQYCPHLYLAMCTCWMLNVLPDLPS